MGDYLVKINGVMNGKDLEKKTSVYTIDVQILHHKEDENIKEVTNVDALSGKFFSDLKPGSRCLLSLGLTFDKVIWHMKGDKYYLNEGNQEITKEEADKMVGCPIP